MDCDIASYHIDSFNYMVDVGAQAAAVSIPPIKAVIGSENVQFKYMNVSFGCPSLDSTRKTNFSENERGNLFPAECRQRSLTYRAPLKAFIEISVNNLIIGLAECIAGEVPVMLRSNICNLRGLSSRQLVKKGEEANEKGGYFICKGSEKVMRLLVANKRNFPLALERPSLCDKGKLFSQYAIMMRCIRGNYSSSLMSVHYLESASIVLCLQYERELFYIPLMYVMKCLTSMSDRKIYEHMTRARPNDSFWAGCVTNMLSTAQGEGVINQQDAAVALGSRFRIVLENRYGPSESDTKMTQHLLKSCVAIHLDSDEEKFFCLVMMAQKLIALVKGEIQPESLDNPQFQEASVSGHIILLMLRERLEKMLFNTRRKLEISYNRSPNNFSVTTESFTKAYTSCKGDITNGLEFFLATGNLVTKDGLGLMQKTGFSIIAERINQLRFVSHFRAIHRGAFFMEMRTTDVRKLRPEGWGFICPVHTPDGAPCGLLNHLTACCRIVTSYSKTKKLKLLLVSVGVFPNSFIGVMQQNEPLYPVILDGNFFGYVPCAKAAFIERYLRRIKVDPKNDSVPYLTEITLIRASTDPKNVMTQFPGLYIYTCPGRFIRPVKNLVYDTVEMIGVFEQVYLSVIIDPNELEQGVTMHQELHPSALFSFAGNLIPFPDHNQSPRNVYQCQMGKQTMGVPVHAWNCRADGKMYLIQTPQHPLIKLESYDKYEMTDYPLGTNACVAVISYTGYDMEDAMVINKASYQRGFAHGSVIKVERLDLAEKKGFTKTFDKVFFSDPKNLCETIGEDGLPILGRIYRKGDKYYSVYDRSTGTFHLHEFKYAEEAWCGMVRVVYDNEIRDGKTHALVQWRISRNPIIGDKFASRHGQKGINSFLWPPESLPFSESGMVPDIIFNPHGFPSRMTIGMMIESMAGKAACMHGSTYDASPFVFNEKYTAIEHFSELLIKSGYNYLGNETMYSGVNGTALEVQIFFGVVYYQRLRHMIADKFQVRSTGSVDPVTLQPVKGRKVGGGIRFGEMERDALIAHGTAFCLQDRLFNCSDKDEAYVCSHCGSIVSVTKLCKKKAMEEEQLCRTPDSLYKNEEFIKNGGGNNESLYCFSMGNELAANALISDSDKETAVEKATARKMSKFEIKNQLQNFTVRHCTVCQRSDKIYLMQIPRVFRFLCAELSSMNIKVRFQVSHPEDVMRS